MMLGVLATMALHFAGGCGGGSNPAPPPPSQGQAATPVFSPLAGTYPAAQSVTITDTTPGAAIHYTTDGSTPTTSSAMYTAAIQVSSTETIEAIAVASGFTNSAVAAATYTIQAQQGATPILVQHTSNSSTVGNVASSYTFQLPNGTQMRNCIVVGFTFSSGYGATPTVSDDKSNAYSIVTSKDDGNQFVALARALDVASGTRQITITFTGGSPTHVAAAASEFYNVATSSADDGDSANSGTGTSVAAGSLSTANDGDLIYQYAVQDTSSNAITSWTQGSAPWTLLSADILDSTVAQYQVQAAHGSINPALTMSPSNNWNSIAIALKSASAGNAPPAGIRIVHIQHNSIPQSFGPTPITIQFPCSGNLIVSVFHGISGYTISGVNDGANTYTSTGPSVHGTGASGEAQMFYARSASSSTTLVQTYTMAGLNDSGGSTVVLYDVTGASASPFDKIGTLVGQQTVSGDFSSASVTPGSAGGLVIADVTVESNTIVGVSPGLFDSATTLPTIAVSPVDQNNGFAHNYNSDTSPETFSWTTSGGPVSWWASLAAAFH
ncbi:MAG: chitobiase/beta-hexosaminidase C-terminal domain-containing protein [Candidatus Acidiferrales bacterium]|jgi:hypothetical protein